MVQLTAHSLTVGRPKFILRKLFVAVRLLFRCCPRLHRNKLVYHPAHLPGPQARSWTPLALARLDHVMRILLFEPGRGHRPRPGFLVHRRRGSEQCRPPGAE